MFRKRPNAERARAELSCGYAAGCEAGLRPAGLEKKRLGLCPWFGLCPLHRTNESLAFVKVQLPHTKESNLMAHRYRISQDSPALYITIVTKDRLPVFRTDHLKNLVCLA